MEAAYRKKEDADLTESQPAYRNQEDPDTTIRKLYRENADLRVKVELLEQSLRDMNNGFLSDDHLRSDYMDLKSKVEEQQRIIEEQNEMLDEAQELMQQLKSDKESLQEQLEQAHASPQDYESQLRQAREREASANKVIEILQQQLEQSQSSLLPVVPEVSDEEDNYSTIHEEIDLITRWLDKMDGLLFDGVSTDSGIQTLESRMDRLFVWCQSRLKEPSASPLDTPYLSLIQREVSELYELVEGNKGTGVPVKQLHEMEDTVKRLLENWGVQSVKMLVESPSGVSDTAIQKEVSNTTIQREVSNTAIQKGASNTSFQRGVSDAEEVEMLRAAVEDKSRAISLMNAQNDRIMELVRSEKQQFERLLHVYRELEQKYDELERRPCANCESLQSKYDSLRETYLRSIEEIRVRGDLIQQYQKALAERSETAVF